MYYLPAFIRSAFLSSWGALNPLIPIIDKDIRQDWPQLWVQLPAGCYSIHHHSLGLAIRKIFGFLPGEHCTYPSHEQPVSPGEYCGTQCQRLFWSLSGQDLELSTHALSGSDCQSRRSGQSGSTCLSWAEAGWAWSPGCPVCAPWWHPRWSTPCPSLGPRVRLTGL